MNSARRPWPPLVVSAHVPRLVKWRDLLITLIMWGFFIVLLDTEFELLFSRYFEWLGVIDADIDPQPISLIQDRFERFDQDRRGFGRHNIVQATARRD